MKGLANKAANTLADQLTDLAAMLLDLLVLGEATQQFRAHVSERAAQGHPHRFGLVLATVLQRRQSEFADQLGASLASVFPDTTGDLAAPLR